MVYFHGNNIHGQSNNKKNVIWLKYGKNHLIITFYIPLSPYSMQRDLKIT